MAAEPQASSEVALGGGTGRRPTWLEGFYDLVFAFAVTQLAGRLARDASTVGVARFVFLFLAVWWAWVGTTVFFDRFDRGQRWLRLAIAVQILAVAALAVHVGDALESGSRDFALAYAIIRLVLVGLYWSARRTAEGSGRAIAGHYAAGFGAAAALWAVSALVPPPLRFAVWGVAMIVDYGTPLTARHLQARSQLDPSHLPERFGLFTLIVLGESIAVTAGSLAGHRWDAQSALAGAFGIAAAFGVWWAYFDHLERAPLRRPRLVGQTWFYGHLPFLMSMTALAIGLRHLAGGDLDAGLSLASLAAISMLAFLLVIRLTAVASRASAAGVVAGTVLGMLTAAVAASVPSAAASAGLLAAALALPGAAEEVSTRMPWLKPGTPA
jgi:low temperature requirement protein LtrA